MTCNTKQSVYYSASSLYMFRVSTTPIIRSTQNLLPTWPHWREVLCTPVITVKVAAQRAATFTVLTPYNVAPQNRNQPHPTLPAKNPTCSNKWSFLLMMGILMPETC